MAVGGADSLSRVPPHSELAEKVILATLLSGVDVHVLEEVITSLAPEDFYIEKHSRIYSAILTLVMEEQVTHIDVAMVRQVLEKKKMLDESMEEYLTYLVTDVMISPRNIAYYVKEVKEKSILRSLIRVGAEIMEMAYDPDHEPREILNAAERMIFEVLFKTQTSREVKPLAEYLREVWGEIRENLEKGKENLLPGISSGYLKLDETIGGLQKGNMIVIGARPAVGKTSFALNIAHNVALGAGKGVLIFSLEMTPEQLALRFLSQISMVKMKRFQTANLSQREIEQVVSALDELSQAPIYIDYSSILTTYDIQSKARKLKSELMREGKELGLIVVDYIQLLSGRGPKGSTRQQEIAEYSRALKTMAIELEVPIIVVSQLTREAERESRRPRLSDLRESGAIEQDADVVIFLYKPDSGVTSSGFDDYEEYISQSGVFDEYNARDVEVIVAKNRNGETGTLLFKFLEDITLLIPEDEFKTQYNQF